MSIHKHSLHMQGYTNARDCYLVSNRCKQSGLNFNSSFIYLSQVKKYVKPTSVVTHSNTAVSVGPIRAMLEFEVVSGLVIISVVTHFFFSLFHPLPCLLLWLLLLAAMLLTLQFSISVTLMSLSSVALISPKRCFNEKLSFRTFWFLNKSNLQLFIARISLSAFVELAVQRLV